VALIEVDSGGPPIPSLDDRASSCATELCAPSSIPIRTLIPRAEQLGKEARHEYVGPFIGDKNRYS